MVITLFLGKKYISSSLNMTRSISFLKSLERRVSLAKVKRDENVFLTNLTENGSFFLCSIYHFKQKRRDKKISNAIYVNNHN